MQTVNWENKEITLIGSGKSVLVFSDEFHMDIFAFMNLFLAQMEKGRMDVNTVSKLFYTFAKTANDDIFKSYRSFMESVTKIGEFANQDLLIALINIVQDTMNTGEKPKEAETDTKKKTTKKKAQ